MLTIIIALVSGLVLGGGLYLAKAGLGWAIFAAIVAALGVAILLSRHFGKKFQAIVGQVQTILEKSRDDANKLVNRLANQPGASPKLAESKLEKLSKESVHQALAVLDGADEVCRWVPLADRQIATLRMQLHYQVKEYDQADKYLEKALMLEPQTLAMKMVRLHQRDDPALEKTCQAAIGRFKYEKATLIYATYAWILVKRKEYDKALEILAEGKEKTENETIQRNWQHLANNKPQHFSNAALGEPWFALQVEAPPKPKASKGQLKGHPLVGKGKRRYF